MKYLVLVGVLAGTAHADGVVLGARVGPSNISSCQGECGNVESPWGVAAGLDVSYAHALSWATVRVGGAFDYAHGHQRGSIGIVGMPYAWDVDIESILAKVELAVLHDIVFVWTGLGGTVVTTNETRAGAHVEVGAGLRYRFTRHDAIRVDASAEINGVQEYGVFQHGFALGLEHYF